MYLGSYRTTIENHFKDETCFFIMCSHYYDQSFYLQRNNGTCQGLLLLSLCHCQSRGSQVREAVLAARAGCAALAAPLLCWESLLYLCLNGDIGYLQLCLLGAVRPDSLALAKYTATWIIGRDKRSVSLFEDPDQRTKGSLDLPLDVHLQKMSD